MQAEDAQTTLQSELKYYNYMSSIDTDYRVCILYIDTKGVRMIAQPLTSRPANPEIRGSSPARGLGLSRSQRLRTGLLLGDREVVL